MAKKRIKIGFSPDSEDAFMFYGITAGVVDCGDIEFDFVLRDIQTLNDWTARDKFDVSVVSVHAYAYLQDRYSILSCGVNMGATELVRDQLSAQSLEKLGLELSADQEIDVHGPLLISKKYHSLDQLKNITIAVPGTITSSYLALQMLIGEFDYLVMMYNEIMDAVRLNKVDAGLIIHDKRLEYKNHELNCIIDMGQWWFDQTGLPMPLGCTVVSKALGPDTMKQINSIIKSSIEYAYNNRLKAIEHARPFKTELRGKSVDSMVNMYINQWLLGYGPLGQKAIELFFDMGHKRGLIPQTKPEFVE
ncbi:MAG: hypothetical protein JEZ07_17695 [Phycisphaerae bacterium]|nr:hypothetical protein [Phycisphaerae bacterium]